ncbi:MAG: NERD domain-containing protein [Ahniella sp.]|nr:NERD domain-containing protein [Ahniella sp.]
MARMLPDRAEFLSRKTPGERRFALRLEEKLDDEYLVWLNVPVGPAQVEPDCLILSPFRGLIALEVRDWKIDQIESFDRHSVSIKTDKGLSHVANPLAQSRQYAEKIIRLLEADPELRFPASHQFGGKLILPWAHGLVFPNIKREQFLANELDVILPAHLVICQDEMPEDCDPQRFQERLWAMFAQTFPCHLSLPEIDRIRWHVFPEVRLGGEQFGLFGTANVGEAAQAMAIPDLVRVMDLQQEALARSLGSGHRVIHGVAGSGKTMILGFRCQQLAATPGKPILVLCYNKTLASRLQQLLAERGIDERVQVLNFHAWCLSMLNAYGLPKPQSQGEAFFSDLVDAVIKAVDQRAIPRGQYRAILIDEGHDFEAPWMRLIVQMLDPATNDLLLLYDDAQSVYQPKQRFSLSSVGIEARGRTTILRLNYRNTMEVLATAKSFAEGVFEDEPDADTEMPIIAPESAGRRGAFPSLVRYDTAGDETLGMIQVIRDAMASGLSVDQIAILYRLDSQADHFSEALAQSGLAFTRAQGEDKASLYGSKPTVKLVSMQSCKGLEFEVVLIPGLCNMPPAGTDEHDEARLLYVAMTRATERLHMSYSRESVFTQRVRNAIRDVQASLQRH